MNITCIVLGVCFVAFGYFFAIGKIHTKMTAWREMPLAEKEKIKIGPLCQNIGQMIMVSGIIFLISGFWKGFRIHLFVWSMVIWLIIAGIDLWDITKHKKYEKR